MFFCLLESRSLLAVYSFVFFCHFFSLNWNVLFSIIVLVIYYEKKKKKNKVFKNLSSDAVIINKLLKTLVYHHSTVRPIVYSGRLNISKSELSGRSSGKSHCVNVTCGTLEYAGYPPATLVWTVSFPLSWLFGTWYLLWWYSYLKYWNIYRGLFDEMRKKKLRSRCREG